MVSLFSRFQSSTVIFRWLLTNFIMRIKFRNLKLQEGVIKVSFDGGYTFQAYNVEDVEEGILLSDSQELDKIRILGSANLLKNLDVISSIQVDAFCEKINKSVDGDITATGDISAKGGNFTGSVAIGGDLNVAGKVVSIDTETITTKENSIELRHDASIGLVPGDVSGVIINNYDGNGSDAQIALDNAGTLRIGDTGDTEPVATRDEAANMTDNNLVKWDAVSNKLVDSGISINDVGKSNSIIGWGSLDTLDNSINIDSLIADIRSIMVTKGLETVYFSAMCNDAQSRSWISASSQMNTNGVVSMTITSHEANIAYFTNDTHLTYVYYNSQWTLKETGFFEDTPIGSVFKYFGNTIPDGWLECGTTHNVADYPELYAKIGRAYTDASVSQTKFSLPTYPEYYNYAMQSEISNWSSSLENGSRSTTWRLSRGLYYVLITFSGASVTDKTNYVNIIQNEHLVYQAQSNDVGTNGRGEYLYLSGDYNVTHYGLGSSGISNVTVQLFTVYSDPNVKFIVKAKPTIVPIDLVEAITASSDNDVAVQNSSKLITSGAVYNSVQVINPWNYKNTWVFAPGDYGKFITTDDKVELTVPHTGIMNICWFKATTGYTIRVKVNGIQRYANSAWGADKMGTGTPAPRSGQAVLFVNEGDVVTVDSDESSRASGNSYYIGTINLNY